MVLVEVDEAKTAWPKLLRAVSSEVHAVASVEVFAPDEYAEAKLLTACWNELTVAVLTI